MRIRSNKAAEHSTHTSEKGVPKAHKVKIPALSLTSEEALKSSLCDYKIRLTETKETTVMLK